MAKARRKMAFAAHAWLGVLSGLLLFVVCFSGAIAVFHEAIYQWEQPGLHVNASEQPHLPIETLLQQARAELALPDDFALVLPGMPYANIFMLYYEQDEQDHAWIVNAATGEHREENQSGIAHILSRMHTDLDLPSPYGRYLVGLSGVVMLFLLVSGIIHHRRFFADLCRLRTRPKLRLTLSDLHKIIGSWGVLFQGMIAFTGSMLGLIGLVLLLMAYTAYDGDAQAALDGFLGPTPPARGIPANMHSMDDLIATAEAHWPGFKAGYIVVNHYQDQAAKVMIYGHNPANLTGIQNISLSAASGDITFVADFRKMGLGAAIYGISDTLHYGEFGGTLVLFVYFLLGLAMAFMGASGMILWLTRQSAHSPHYGFYARLSLGVIAGIICATATLFISAIWLPDEHAQRTVYYGIWLGMVSLAFVLPSQRDYLDLSIIVCAVACCAAPLSAWWHDGRSIWSTLAAHQYPVVAVDMVLLLCGAGFLALYWRLHSAQTRDIKS